MRYRKKPVEIDAMLFDGSLESYNAIVNEFSASDIWHESYARIGGKESRYYLKIRTLEGIMTALPGDYVIRGVIGELYPCKPSVFNATYERADNESV